MGSAAPDAGGSFVRRKTVSAHNDATMRTVADFGEFGQVVVDEPVAHGGAGEGPSPLQASGAPFRYWGRCVGVRR